MGYEDISGTRTMFTDYLGGTITAASTVQVPELNSLVMWKPFTITGITQITGTTAPAGTSMRLRVVVNGARKGLATVTLSQSGAVGDNVNTANGLAFTGPANSLVALRVASVGASVAGIGARYMIRYHHGWSA